MMHVVWNDGLISNSWSFSFLHLHRGCWMLKPDTRPLSLFHGWMIPLLLSGWSTVWTFWSVLPCFFDHFNGYVMALGSSLCTICSKIHAKMFKLITPFCLFVGGSECTAIPSSACKPWHWSPTRVRTPTHTPTCQKLAIQNSIQPNCLLCPQKTKQTATSAAAWGGDGERGQGSKEKRGKKNKNHTTIWKKQMWQDLPAVLIHLFASSGVAQGIGSKKNGGWARPWELEPQSLACTTKASAILTYDKWFSLLDKHGKRWRMSHRQAAILPSAAGLQPSTAFALYPYILSLSPSPSHFIPLLQSQDKSERVYDLYTA